MKKILTALLCVLVATLSILGFSGCDGKKSVKVFVPDGAPALSVAYLLNGNGNLEREAEYNVVNASAIQTYVTGNNPQADIAIIPVNMASKLLGTGEKYKMLGSVTHGNLFLVKRASTLPDISTPADLENLKGKTVGVPNIANMPGLTFKTILSMNGIAYNELGNSGETASDKVNLKAFADAGTMTPVQSDCDYFVMPEPAATTKTNATPMEMAGNLQTLYGGENGYPQAVLVAKTELISSDPDFISDFMQAMDKGAKWLLDESVSGETIYNAISNRYDAEPSFKPAQLSKTVISNCAISFVSSKECKSAVNEFLQRLIAVDANFAKPVSDNFYYIDA